MTRPTIDSMSPFFIVASLDRSLAFYRDKLGFEISHQEPPAPQDPFFAVLNRDGAMLFVKSSGYPLPNPKRYSWARWDAYLLVQDPDALAAEFAAKGATFSDSLKDTHDGLRGFELNDPDGYVLFFGRPR
jgi:catechol 2,3-dioxygenase-like lactoylglutathione lyase family enzyme